MPSGERLWRKGSEGLGWTPLRSRETDAKEERASSGPHGRAWVRGDGTVRHMRALRRALTVTAGLTATSVIVGGLPLLPVDHLPGPIRHLAEPQPAHAVSPTNCGFPAGVP